MAIRNAAAILVVPLLALCSGCIGNTVPNTAVTENSTFQPMEPADYESYWEEGPQYEDSDGDGIYSNKEKLYSFPNELMQLFSSEQRANVNVPIVGATAKGSAYNVVVDYSMYRVDELDDAFYRAGVGIRMRANLVAMEAGIDLSSLSSLGFAASAGKVSGVLSFETIGISGPLITPLIPVPTSLSTESIQAALQSAAAIKANIYDEETSIVPQVFARKPASGAQ
jgi:hypothetical protein